MRGSGTSGSRQGDCKDEGTCLCPRRRAVEWRKRRPGIVPATGRSVQRRQGLGQTNSPAIEVSQRDGKFGRQGEPVGGEGSREDPAVGGYASGSAQSWELRNQPFWTVQWLLYVRRPPPVRTCYWSGKRGKKL